MSALGQKRTLAPQQAMSALPPKADIVRSKERCPLCARSGHPPRRGQVREGDNFLAAIFPNFEGEQTGFGHSGKKPAPTNAILSAFTALT